MTPRRGHYRRALGYPRTGPVTPLLLRRTVLEQQSQGAAGRGCGARRRSTASAARARTDAASGVDAAECGELCDEVLRSCPPPPRSCRAARVLEGRGRRRGRSDRAGPGRTGRTQGAGLGTGRAGSEGIRTESDPCSLSVDASA